MSAGAAPCARATRDSPAALRIEARSAEDVSMYTCFRSLAAFSGSFAAFCALVAASSPTAAQVAKGPSGSTARGLSLGGPPRFVGHQLGLGEQPVDVALADLDGDGDQ